MEIGARKLGQSRWAEEEVASGCKRLLGGQLCVGRLGRVDLTSCMY